MPHQFPPSEYDGMSGNNRIKKFGGIGMCNFGGNGGFCGGNMCWIIILILLLCCCGSGSNGCECDSGCRC